MAANPFNDCGRDPKTGRWLSSPANRGAAQSNPVYLLREQVYKAITPEDIHRLVRSLVDIATEGENVRYRIEAARCLLQHLIGKPRKESLVEKREAKVNVQVLSDQELNTI